MRAVFVSREVYPLGGGGIGQFVSAAAQLLSRIAEVTVLTTSVFEQRYEQLRAQGDERLPGTDVRFAFVPEPTVEEAASWYHVMHLYGHRILTRLQELFPTGGPELIEFPDFLGEAFVTLQAAEAFDPFLTSTRICVRIHTTAEICEVLDGFLKHDLSSRALHEMERFSLAHADRLIWQGGDVLGTYQRFYGADRLAPDMRIRYPYVGPAADPRQDAGFSAPRPLRLLYAGRLERRKGVQNLVRAVTGMPRDDLHLTMHGSDTTTAPLGVSVREQLELEIADDPRITLGPPLERGDLAQAIREHDAVVIPSLWECWPYAALEPMHLNRPLLATPVGGMCELIRPGRSGWLTPGTDPVALEEALVALLETREGLAETVVAGGPHAQARSLSNDEEILDGYQAVMRDPPRLQPRRSKAADRSNLPPAGTPAPPLVSAVVPYYRASSYVREAVESLLAQTYPRIEIVLVNDGSFQDEDRVVAELAARMPVVVVTQINQGLGAARNFGIEQSRGRYFFPLDADNVAEPEFVARCVEVLERRSEVAYVTAWSRYIEADGTPRAGPVLGYQPLGNHAELVGSENVAGDAAALVRRRLFDAGFRYSEELTSFEDWHLYRELGRAGHIGAIIPERLLRYRVREDSLQAQFAQPRRARLLGEIDALMRENEVRWTSSSA